MFLQVVFRLTAGLQPPEDERVTPEFTPWFLTCRNIYQLLAKSSSIPSAVAMTAESVASRWLLSEEEGQEKHRSKTEAVGPLYSNVGSDRPSLLGFPAGPVGQPWHQWEDQFQG